ncbi:MAG: hypothetical protein FJ267_15460 [Planctomycetes bacterium]|nr:hypothetical protein [Planctomycetota bacterium]
MLKALMLVLCLLSCGCVTGRLPTMPSPTTTTIKERITVVQKPPYVSGPEIEVMLEADFCF